MTDFDALWDVDDPARNEKVFKDFLEALKIEGNPRPFIQLKLLTLLARAQVQQGNSNDAQNTLAVAEQLVGSVAPEEAAEAKVRLNLEQGRALCAAKTPARARPLFLEAWELANKAGDDFLSIDAARMVALTEPQKMQTEWNLKALAIAEASDEPKVKKWLDALYLVLGWHFFELRQYTHALELFNKAFTALEEQYRVSPDAGTIKRLRVAKWAIAKTLRFQGQIEEALLIQKNLWDETTQSSSPNGDISEELGECLTSLKRSSEAATYFEIAHRELSKDPWIIDNMPERINRLKSLAKAK